MMRFWHTIGIIALSVMCARLPINAEAVNPYKPSQETNYDKFLQFDWVVTGCQAISLAAIGSLLDHGINPDRILWMSDSFTITLEANNASVDNREAMAFLRGCKAFKSFIAIIEQYKKNPADTINPQQILQFVIKKLRKQIQSTTVSLDTLCFEPSIKRYSFSWYTNTVLTKNIIITSAYFPNTQNTLRSAETTSTNFSSHDVVAVIGSLAEGTYATSLLREYPIKKIIHFYTDKEVAKLPSSALPATRSCNTPACTKKNEPKPEQPANNADHKDASNSSVDTTTPCEVICVAHNADNAFALLPECTRIVYCPSAPAGRLPQFINIPFYKIYQNSHAYAPGLFLLNPELLRKTNQNKRFVDTMLTAQERVSDWLHIR